MRRARGWLLLAGAAVVVVGVGAGVASGVARVACWARAPLPRDLPVTAERLDEEASHAGAGHLLAERYAAYRQRLTEARGLFRREANRWCLLQDRDPVVRAFTELEREGQALLQAARSRAVAVRQELGAHLHAAERRLARLRFLQSELGLYIRSTPVAVADVALREARRYLDTGLYERARGRVDSAAASLAKAEGQAWVQVARYTGGPTMQRWQRWLREAAAASRSRPVIVVAKAERRLLVYRHGRVVASHPVDLGYNGLADKLYEGDGATPEGQFRVVAKKSGAQTRYYRALLLDYPTPDHRRRHQVAVRRGLLPRHARIGGLIEIHGRGPADTTNGCVSMNHPALAALYEMVEVGTPVTIVGAVSAVNPVARQVRAWRSDGTL
jgi:hypothetical protein